MYRNLKKNEKVIVYGKIDNNMSIRVEKLEIVKFKMRKYKNI